MNTSSREEVRTFYNAVYSSSEGVPMDSTASTATCTPGTNSTAFKEAVLRRINWFRAMSGIPAAVTFDANNNSEDQEAALMMSRNNRLSHTPTNTWFCWTASGSNAANYSNLSLGSAGPDAITDHMQDHGTNNKPVGHRRWLLYPQTQVMGTGDVPRQGGYVAANATWVIDANYGGPRPATRTPYVTWPPAGYVPYQVVYPRWSFALSNAVFTNATVTMRSNGVSVGVAPEPFQANIGENTVVWVPLGLDANNQNTVFPFNGADTVYNVTVTNIQVGLTTTGYTYSVTVFDPAVPGADHYPPLISGPSEPAVGQNNAYTFTAVSNATSYQWRATLRTPFNFSDGAETGLGSFLVSTSGGYALRITAPVASGSYAFNLQHPAPPTSQIMTLTQTVVPRTNSVLTFKSRLAWAWSDEYAKVQASTNGGAAWFDLYSQPGDSGQGESVFTLKTIPLTVLADLVTQFRFNYYFVSGSYYPPDVPGDGWVIDDIVLTNAELATILSTNATATTNFTFNPSQAGTYTLDVRAFIFTEFPLDWGPVKTVTTVNAPPVIMLGKPVVISSQVQLDFTVASGSAAAFKLLQVNQLGVAWTTNESATLTTNIPGSSYRFTATVGPAARFYRVLAL